MKTFVYLIICIVTFSIGSLFVLKKPDGQPWLKVTDFYNHQAIKQNAINLKNTVINKTNALINNDSDPTIYKWQDEQGIWHYSDSNNTNAEAWIKPENLTVIPAIKPLDKNEVKSSKSDVNEAKVNTTSSKTSKVKSLIDDTNNVQNIMDNRTKNIDKQLQNLQ